MIRNRLRGMAMLKALAKDLANLEERNRIRKIHRPDFKARELLNERDFVRLFGTKVRKVRLSGRPDFVGLMVVGANTGFLVVAGEEGKRKARLLDVLPDGHLSMTHRYINLRDTNSMTNLWRGLLNYVQ